MQAHDEPLLGYRVRMLKRTVVGFLSLQAAAGLAAAAEPVAFKLGTFERGGRRFLGVVLREELFIDLAAADAAVPGGGKLGPLTDMKDAIARYDPGLRTRIRQIVDAMLEQPPRPSWVMDLTTVRTLAPILYPTTMLNVAVNYREHGVEMAGRDPNAGAPAGQPAASAPGAPPPGTTSISGIWERKPGEARWNPYMFIKLPSAVIAAGEAIRIPPGRTQIDWECELGIVIGREARQVPVARARDYIFGYTIEHDVSDRGGRGDPRHGSDWLIAKSHDTFAPMGPFVVPAEFVADPQKLAVRFTLNGQLMQDASTSLMIHDVYELVSYASHITTLRPGDVIATGTPAGVGSGRKPPIFLKAGDVAACTYEGIGTLTNPVAAAQ
jgi:2-keto-4-pentenoate hydratase/2-oxohepta-3-ene-1,7-dioic acid hydratase in catechol pathway